LEEIANRSYQADRFAEGASPRRITHEWLEDGKAGSATRTQPAGARAASYQVNLARGAKVKSVALNFETP
jgi:hypothetical protein